jgi:signal transduction histidine kinase
VTVLHSLRRNHLVQFALVSLGVTLLSALAITAYVSYRLDGQIDLLGQHGAAMMSGPLDASSPYSISSIQQNVDDIRWGTLMIASAALVFVYLSSLAAVRRGWNAVKRQQAADREGEELRWQNARLREIDQMKSELVALASHELRTPLTTIYGFSKVLAEREELPAEEREWAGYIESEASRLTEIVDGLLNVSRIESGRMVVGDERVEFDEVISTVLAGFAQVADGHSFLRDGEAGVVVRGDRSKLIEVLSNLVDNAVKYSPDGGPITIACQREGTSLKVSVSDRGLGIPGSELPRLFERFHRIERPETEHIRSTGLGLYIVRELVTLMGGDVAVASVAGESTTVTLSLRLAAVAPADQEVAA